MTDTIRVLEFRIGGVSSIYLWDPPAGLGNVNPWFLQLTPSAGPRKHRSSAPRLAERPHELAPLEPGLCKKAMTQRLQISIYVSRYPSICLPHLSTSVFTCPSVLLPVYLSICVCTYIYTNIYRYIYIYMYTYVYIYIYMYVRMYLYWSKCSDKQYCSQAMTMISYVDTQSPHYTPQPVALKLQWVDNVL